MNSTTYSPKPVEKVSSDDDSLSFDLLSQLTHMSILSLAGVPRDWVFRSSGDLALGTGTFFLHVYRLVKFAGMEYSQALKLVAGLAKASSIRSLFLRFSAAISSGESERDFVNQERESSAERYKNEYDRHVENLKKWTDAYAAIMVSVTLIMVVSLVATMMSTMDVGFVAVMAATVVMVATLGVYLIYRAAPVEKLTYDGAKSMPQGRRLARTALYICVPLGVLSGVFIGSRFGLFPGSAIAFMCVGASLVPSGLLAMKDDADVRRFDSSLYTFLRTIGSVAGSIGSDLGKALDHIDVESMGHLSSLVTRLRLRTGSGIPTEICWDAFRDESGSELVNRSSRMLVEGVEAGAKPDLAGAACSEYAMAISQLRAKRSLTASTFTFLTVPMHATMIFILVFVTEVLVRFNNKIEDATRQVSGYAGSGVIVPEGLSMPNGLALGGGQNFSPDHFLLGSGDLGPATLLIVGVVLALTVANGLAPAFASGGSNLKIAFHLSIACLISGIVMAVVPMIAGRLFVI